MRAEGCPFFPLPRPKSPAASPVNIPAVRAPATRVEQNGRWHGLWGLRLGGRYRAAALLAGALPGARLATVAFFAVAFFAVAFFAVAFRSARRLVTGPR